jgi:hypothetical protein
MFNVATPTKEMLKLCNNMAHFNHDRGAIRASFQNIIGDKTTQSHQTSE